MRNLTKYIVVVCSYFLWVAVVEAEGQAIVTIEQFIPIAGCKVEKAKELSQVAISGVSKTGHILLVCREKNSGVLNHYFIAPDGSVFPLPKDLTPRVTPSGLILAGNVAQSAQAILNPLTAEALTSKYVFNYVRIEALGNDGTKVALDNEQKPIIEIAGQVQKLPFTTGQSSIQPPPKFFKLNERGDTLLGTIGSFPNEVGIIAKLDKKTFKHELLPLVDPMEPDRTLLPVAATDGFVGGTSYGAGNPHAFLYDLKSATFLNPKFESIADSRGIALLNDGRLLGSVLQRSDKQWRTFILTAQGRTTLLPEVVSSNSFTINISVGLEALPSNGTIIAWGIRSDHLNSQLESGLTFLKLPEN